MPGAALLAVLVEEAHEVSGRARFRSEAMRCAGVPDSASCRSKNLFVSETLVTMALSPRLPDLPEVQSMTGEPTFNGYLLLEM